MRPVIETRLLQQFVAVAEELHFHRAAQRLHMAQPPLSQAIRRLEEQLGVALLERSPRKVVLTPAGASFLDTARRALAQLDEGAALAQRVAAGQAGRLAILFVGTAHAALLPGLLRAYRAYRPQVALALREATTAEQIEALQQGDADIGLMRWPGAAVPRLSFEQVARERVLVALPDDHALAARPRVALADLARDDFIATPRTEGAGFHDQLVGLCRHAGFSPRVVQEARELATVLSLVAGGLGVALLPDSLAAVPRPGVVWKPITVNAPQDMLCMDLVAAWDASRTMPARDSFLAVARRRRPARRIASR